MIRCMISVFETLVATALPGGTAGQRPTAPLGRALLAHPAAGRCPLRFAMKWFQTPKSCTGSWLFPLKGLSSTRPASPPATPISASLR